MKRFLILALLAVWFTVPFVLVVGQQPTVEQRLERLEQKIDQLSRRLGINLEEPADLSGLSGNEHLRFGNPGCDGNLLVKPQYVICHRNDWKIPKWVTYHLSAENLQGNAARSDDFRPDPELPEGQRSELADYRNSGFDRGHMAPAADFKRSKVAMSETFLLSNMTPQTPNLNRRMWANLEDQVRSLANTHGSIWIFTGSLFLDAEEKPVQPARHIGPNQVAVPTHFYKAILCDHGGGNFEMFAFILPNQRPVLSGTPRDYIVTVDKVQQLSHLDFFAGLPDEQEKRLETTKATNWPVQ